MAPEAKQKLLEYMLFYEGRTKKRIHSKNEREDNGKP